MSSLLEEARETLRQTFPDRLTQLLPRKKVGEFQGDTGILGSHALRLKKGERLPSAAVVLAISRYFEVSVDELISAPRPTKK